MALGTRLTAKPNSELTSETRKVVGRNCYTMISPFRPESATHLHLFKRIQWEFSACPQT